MSLNSLTHHNIFLETISTAILIVDSNSHLRKNNPSFNKFLRYEEDEHLRKTTHRYYSQ